VIGGGGNDDQECEESNGIAHISDGLPSEPVEHDNADRVMSDGGDEERSDISELVGLKRLEANVGHHTDDEGAHLRAPWGECGPKPDGRPHDSGSNKMDCDKTCQSGDHGSN
jgi:hypothetical protein